MRTLPSLLCCCRQTVQYRLQRTRQSADTDAVLTLPSLMPCPVLQAWLKLVKSGALPTVNAFLIAVLLTIARVKRWETTALDLLKVSWSAVSHANATDRDMPWKEPQTTVLAAHDGGLTC